jgi:anti-sigma regulatory factor (Ser/Thr protein kinase)
MDDLIAATRAPDSVTGTRRLAMPATGHSSRRVQGVAPECLNLAAAPTASGQARHFAARVLRRWQAPPEVIQAAEIIVSELVTNACRASVADARQPDVPGPGTAGCVCLELSRMPGQVVIEVSDHSQDLPVRSDAGADAEDGRGLMLVQAYSEQWGYRCPPSGGKVVYAILSVPGEH